MSRAVVISTIKYVEPLPQTKDKHGKIVAEGVLRASVVLGQNIWGRALFCWIIGRDGKDIKRRLLPNIAIDCEPQYFRDPQHIPAQIAAFMAPPNYFVGNHIDMTFASIGIAVSQIQCFDLGLSRVLDDFQHSADMLYVSPFCPNLRIPELAVIFSKDQLHIRKNDEIEFRNIFLD